MNDFESSLFQNWIQKIQNKLPLVKPRIIFPEGNNLLVQTVVTKLVTKGLIVAQLVFLKRNDIPSTLKKEIQCLVVEEQDLKSLAKAIHHWKAKKWTLKQTHQLMKNPYYFATSWLKLDKSEGLVGGIDCPTSELVRPAIQIVGVSANSKMASSAFLLSKNKEKYLFTDCAMNPEPNAEQLTNIALNALQLGTQLELSPLQLAFLSFSTKGSGGEFPCITRINKAQNLLQKYQKQSNFTSIGEVQFDTAFSNIIRKKKIPNNNWKTPANIYVFPDLNSGNIGYKIAQEMGQFQAIGPLLIGLNKPVCDLSRGAKMSDIEGSILFVLFIVLKNRGL